MKINWPAILYYMILYYIISSRCKFGFLLFSVVMNKAKKLEGSGDEMPVVGLGTWKIPNDVCTETVYLAIKVFDVHGFMFCC